MSQEPSKPLKNHTGESSEKPSKSKAKVQDRMFQAYILHLRHVPTHLIARQLHVSERSIYTYIKTWQEQYGPDLRELQRDSISEIMHWINQATEHYQKVRGRRAKLNAITVIARLIQQKNELLGLRGTDTATKLEFQTGPQGTKISMLRIEEQVALKRKELESTPGAFDTGPELATAV
jgi:hypothetical protein